MTTYQAQTPTKCRVVCEVMKKRICSCRWQILINLLVCGICLVLIQFSLLLSCFPPQRILYVDITSTSCTIPSEIINPTTDSSPIFCTSHVPLPNPTVKLENIFGAIQTQMIYQYVIIILLLTDEWMYASTNGLGCYCSCFHSHVM